MQENILEQRAASRLIGTALSLLARASEKDIGRLLRLVERIAPASQKHIVGAAHEAWQNDAAFGRLLKRVVTELNPRAKHCLLADFLVNNNWGTTLSKREAFAREEGFCPPFTFLISPSMRCNLRCTGCYAGDYAREDELSFEVIDRLVSEGKDMGIYFVTVLGGEPFIRPDMWQIYAKHNDVYFQVFTNGTLLDQENVARLVELGNVAPVLSIEGWQEETDARRGHGVYARIMQAFDRLRRAGVLFGFSAMATRHNVEILCSEAFNDMLVEKGCFFGWHFLYMPVGHEPNLDLMPTPRQREYLRVHGAAHIRGTLPLFVADFWNDAPYVGGCIAGGRRYLHINSRGDVEPCIFAHFAVDNVKRKTLREALRSSFFRAIRARQPYGSNLLRPCMLIDHPWVFREVYRQEQPYATHPEALSLVSTLCPGLDRYAQETARILERAWEDDFVARGCSPETASAMERCSQEVRT